MFIVHWDCSTHLHIEYVFIIKMITGFNIRNGDLTWREKIKNLHAYTWIFGKEHGACCMGGNYCLTFTYDKVLKI
jgi:hypothetical protein